MTAASTVIVGGGVVGCAAAFFLAERGERDVVLLERGQLGQGTSKGGLGGIRHQFDDELDVRLSKLAVAFWRAFEDRTGARHDFQQRGYLFIAETREGLEQLRGPIPLYERIGVNVEMIDRAEIERLVPGIRTDDLAGGRFGAEDGYGDPIQALAGFAAFAHLGGVKIREDIAALEVVRERDRVTGVRTSEGLISCDRVLLATGCWTASLAATAGVAVPIWPYARSIMESRPFPALSARRSASRCRTSPATVAWRRVPPRHPAGSSPASSHRSSFRRRSSRGSAPVPHGGIRSSPTSVSPTHGPVTTR